MTFLEDVDRALQNEGGLDTALRLTIARFGADTGTVHLLEDDGNLHLASAADGIPEAVLAAVRVIPPGKGMAGEAYLHRRAVNACNIQTDQSGAVNPGARATAMSGALVVPVLDGEAAVGALGVANREERVFTSEETELLIEVGRRIAARRG